MTIKDKLKKFVKETPRGSYLEGAIETVEEDDGLKFHKRPHRVWLEYARIKEHALPPVIGKYQYIAESDKGVISIIEMPDYFHDTRTVWESMALYGPGLADELFEEPQRFSSLEEAKADARKHLGRPKV
jgi:hypothetical protein